MSLAVLSGPSAIGLSFEPAREAGIAAVDVPRNPEPFTVSPVVVGSDGKIVVERPEILADGSAADGESIKTTVSAVEWEGAEAGLPGELKLAHPVANFRLTSRFGWRQNPTGPGSHIHIGQDYAVPCGTPVRASEAGTVTQSAWAGHSGYRVRIDHGSGTETAYSHNSRLVAKVGDKVRQGDLIALAGTTGNSTGCHVHFEVYRNGKWTDPAYYVPRVPGQPIPLSPEERERLRNSINPPRDSASHEPLLPAGSTTPKPATSPSPSKKPSATPSPSASPTPSESPAPKPKPKPKPSESPSPTPPESSSPKPKPSGSPTPKPSAPPAESESPAASESPTPTKPAPEPTPTEKVEAAKPAASTSPSPSPKPAASSSTASAPAPTSKPSPSPASETTAPPVESEESAADVPVVESSVSPSPDPSGSLLEPIEDLLDL
ncbi:M23 family metallopeptidase [Zhihengliuella halotolerans]|uniref:Murein DD-endopeptidase MepM/ murein hydrolase activator NlpD n=1 Tax=Zhihengliuella halotolerans TaxID=370736 RepID=A0A4Q8AI94_9MICC|nr:M23 family metallopeptidase [Zhihengliuella halotolerans]RZU63523.1 murein DD-endopeptidase MepM/ murein hydrolase activator NlpD [Zhihengliuella halotolerans]